MILNFIGEDLKQNKNDNFVAKLLHKLKGEDITPMSWGNVAAQAAAFKQRREKYMEFLPLMISKLGTCFATPEEEVIKQNEDSAEILIISKGDCVVNIKD